jgi:transposase
MATGGRLSKIAELTRSAEVTTTGPITVGIDLGDRYSHCCFLGPNGECLTEGRIRTTPEALARHFQGLPPARIAIEVGGHSRWISQRLTAWGHEVLVANARMVQLIASGVRKSDQVDAQLLARLARTDPTLLAPITHVGHQHYPDIARLRARALLVRTRTRLINAVRGIVKTVGVRLPACNTRGFAGKAASLVPSELQPSLDPLLETIATLSAQIKEYDRAVEHIAHEQYPDTSRLRQVPGVGPVPALQFVLTIGDPHRFRRSRDVGAFLGLVPRRRQSGASEQQLRISKAGNSEMRTLLVQCAQYILGRFGPDTDLKRWGTAMATRGGKNAKRRAIIAVARKLSVLLHKLWMSGAVYDPLYNAAAALKSA